MKKRIIAVLMTFVMLFSVLPLNAFASGDDSVVWAGTYDELVAAMANYDVYTLYIAATHPAKDADGNLIYDENGNSVLEPFVWPEGECTLNLETINAPYISVSGDWVIPENVTVNQYAKIVYPDDKSSITCNGTWNRMSKEATLDSGGDFILNGTMTIPQISGYPHLLQDANGGVFYNNGRIEIADGTNLVVRNLVMGDGAVVAGSTRSSIDLLASSNAVGTVAISCPSGSASIETALSVRYGTTSAPAPVLSGDIDMAEINMNYGYGLEIAEGAHITTMELNSATSSSQTATLDVKGTLELAADSGEHFSDNGTINLADGAELIVRAYNNIGYEGSTSTITGTGTIKLYADLNQGKVLPRTAGTLYWLSEERPANVADTVTIWRSWIDNDCTHNWVKVSTTEPNCCLTGVTVYSCSDCGVRNEDDIKPATEEHEFTYEANPNYTDRMWGVCTTTNFRSIIRIRANNATLTPGVPVETAWVTGLPTGVEAEIVYTDNDKAGTATASVTIGGVTIYTTFEITEASNVIGVKASGSGWIYDEDREGYFANFTTLEPVFSGESYNIQSVDSRAWYTSDYKVPANKLATEPKPGETYYFSIRMSQSGIDFTHVTAENCSVSLEGFDVEITEVDTETAGLVWITVKATMHKAAITAPTNVKASIVASSGKPKITWDKVEGAVKYEVWRATTSTGKGSRMSSPTGTTLTNKSAKPGTKYYYYVLAVAEDGTVSEASDRVSIVCDYAQPVVTITNDAATGKPKLTWTAVEGATSYKIYRATSKTGTYSVMKTQSGTSYINNSAVVNKTYYYKVKAFGANSAATSAYSAVVSRLCDLKRPTVTLSNVASTGKIKVAWTKVDGAAKYQVYRATSKTGTYSLKKTTTSLSWTDTNTTAGKTYYYKVKAVHSNTNANSALTAYKSRMADLKRPTVSITTSSGKPKVSWTAVTGATKYQIYRSTSKTGTYKLVKTTTAKYWKDTTAVKGKTYYYKVVAVHSNTNANSAYSTVVSKKCTK